jgi:hypothetical protein
MIRELQVWVVILDHRDDGLAVGALGDLATKLAMTSVDHRIIILRHGENLSKEYR